MSEKESAYRHQYLAGRLHEQRERLKHAQQEQYEALQKIEFLSKWLQALEGQNNE